MITALLGKYGRLSKEVKEYIAERQSIIPDEEQDSIVQKILRECKKAPDLSYIQNLLQGYEPKKSVKPYYWFVCMQCGTEYGGNMEMCPSCFDKGFKCTTVRVKESEEQPDLRNVIRYNKTYVGNDQTNKNCYSCEERTHGFCSHFGAIDYKCKDFEYCNCKICCANERRINKELLKEYERGRNKNPIFATPLAQIKNYSSVLLSRTQQR